MIKFFRRIRKQLLADNKFTKYLLYAVGEIVLVVIGILIALQINNKNEAQNNETRFVKVLKEIRQDLETDLINSVSPLEGGKEMDSLTALILKNKLTKEDYLKKENRKLFWVGFQFNVFDYQKTSFKKIETFKGVIPEKYNQLNKKINIFYNVTGKFYDDIYNNFREQIKERNDYLANNYNWYYLFRKGETTEEMLDFYLNNPTYKNWISRHQADHTTSKHGVLNLFQIRGFELIAQINEVLNDGHKIENKELLKKFGEPLEEDTDLIGKYSVNDSQETFIISKKAGYLFIGNNIIKRVNKDTLSYIRSKTSLEVAIRNKKGTVIGVEFINLKDSTQNEYSKKIKDD